jgi:riboflavin transporter FmnP
MNTENFMKFYIFGAVLPFNALLATLVGIITFFVYKRISIIFKKDFIGKGKKHENNNC